MHTEPEGYTSDEHEQSVEGDAHEEPQQKHKAEQSIPDGDELVQSTGQEPQWAGGERTMVYKVQRDGTFKRLHVEMHDGSAILQMWQILKRYLKLNIAKVVITLWTDGEDEPELNDNVVVSPSTLYHIRVRNLASIATTTSRGQLGGQTRVIGAPKC
eukprot:5844941-Amphidinium_carterae.1